MHKLESIKLYKRLIEQLQTSLSNSQQEVSGLKGEKSELDKKHKELENTLGGEKASLESKLKSMVSCLVILIDL